MDNGGDGRTKAYTGASHHPWMNDRHGSGSGPLRIPYCRHCRSQVGRAVTTSTAIMHVGRQEGWGLRVVTRGLSFVERVTHDDVMEA